jgi:hypothetical protein
LCSRLWGDNGVGSPHKNSWKNNILLITVVLDLYGYCPPPPPKSQVKTEEHTNKTELRGYN